MNRKKMKEERTHCCLWVTWGQREWGVRRKRRSPEETETDSETRDKRGRDQMHRWKELHSFLSFVLIYFSSSSFGFSSWRTSNCSPLIQEAYTESEGHTVDKQSCKSVDNNDMRSLWERTLLFSGNEKKKLLSNEIEGQGSLLCLIKSQAGICWKATRNERDCSSDNFKRWVESEVGTKRPLEFLFSCRFCCFRLFSCMSCM